MTLVRGSAKRDHAEGAAEDPREEDMIRNTKILGLAIVAALALTAVMASAASATNFTAASFPVKISGTQSSAHKFVVAGGTVTCKVASFSGEATAPSETQTINPIYDECTAFGFVGATVTGFSSTTCDYKLFASGSSNLECKSGDVQIDAGTCTVTLQNQTGLTKTTYVNNASGTVTATHNVTGIHATVTAGFGCPIGPPETKITYTNAEYTGTTTLEGKNSKGVAVAIDVN
jgi:hypothetical protein